MRAEADGADHDQADDLLVRPARPEDRGAVLAFCDRIWGEHDYIRWVWDTWLREQQAGSGVVLVAVLAGRPVGITHMRLVNETESWLEGIRVDPGERRQGIGRALTSRALVAAREHGAAVARLLVDADNLASQGLVGRFGFVRVAELERYRAPALSTEEKAERIPLTTPGEGDFERIWAWLEQSNLTPFNGGLEIDAWVARAITEPVLRAHLAADEVRLLEEWGTIQALAVLPGAEAGGSNEEEAGEEGATLHVYYLDGSSEGIGRMALSLRRIAGERGLEQVKVWLPNLLILRDAMHGAGYRGPDDDEPMYLYAREL